MRALNKGWIGIALIILFGASLFFFRGSARYSNLFNSDNFVANVSGTQISTTQFLRSLEMNIGQFAQMIGEELTGEQIRAFQIHQLVLQNLVNNAIFENEFDNKNFILDDTTIAEKTKKRFPNFYVNNKINDDVLNNFLRQQRLKIEDLVNIINYETRADVFDSLFFEKKYPTELLRKISRVNMQSRIIDLIELPYEEIQVPNLSENSLSSKNSEIIEYYNENKFNYLSNETRDLTYLILDKNKFKDIFIPSLDEINEYFINNKEIFTVPEKRSFKQFNFKTIDEAQSFRSEINKLSKAEISKYILEKNIKFNEFKEVDNNQVLDELSKEIFSLEVDQISAVIETTLAVHVIVLNEIIPQREINLDEASEEIKNILVSVQSDNYFNDLKLKINQEILDGFSLDEIETENNLFVKKISNISLNDNEEDELIKYIKNVAFSQNKDFISDIYDYNENISIIVNVDNIYPSKEQDIDKVYEEVLKDFIISKKNKFIENTFERNANNDDLTSINSIFNKKIEEIFIKPNSEKLPSSLLKNIFNNDINEINYFLDNDKVYFFKVKEIQVPDEIPPFQELNLLADFKNAFGNEIIKKKKISFNDELINGLLSQYK